MVNLDLLTYAGNLDNLTEVSGDSRYRFAKGDIHDRRLVEELFSKYEFDTVVNLPPRAMWTGASPTRTFS